MQRLRGVDSPLSQFLDHATTLGPQLGPLLMQLPPHLQLDLSGLDELLKRLPVR